MDNLFTQLSNGNMNPRIGTKTLAGTDVSYAREANGAGNESRIIGRLMQLYGP